MRIRKRPNLDDHRGRAGITELTTNGAPAWQWREIHRNGPVRCVGAPDVALSFETLWPP